MARRWSCEPKRRRGDEACGDMARRWSYEPRCRRGDEASLKCSEMVVRAEMPSRRRGESEMLGNGSASRSAAAAMRRAGNERQGSEPRRGGGDEASQAVAARGEPRMIEGVRAAGQGEPDMARRC